MRFFLDSNILVSGIAFTGIEQWILRATFGREHTFVISEDVLREARDALRKRFPRLQPEAEEILSLIRVEVVPAEAYAARLEGFPELRDPKDAHVLAAAIVSKCDAVVTGDKDLLIVGEAEGVRIIRPTQARRLMSATS